MTLIIPSIEKTRKASPGGFNFLVAVPLLTGMLCQVIPVGVTLPLYWMSFILGGYHKLSSQSAVITQAHAESLLFGTFLGLVIPSIGMISSQDTLLITLWQRTASPYLLR